MERLERLWNDSSLLKYKVAYNELKFSDWYNTRQLNFLIYTVTDLVLKIAKTQYLFVSGLNSQNTVN